MFVEGVFHWLYKHTVGNSIGSLVLEAWLAQSVYFSSFTNNSEFKNKRQTMGTTENKNRNNWHKHLGVPNLLVCIYLRFPDMCAGCQYFGFLVLSRGGGVCQYVGFSVLSRGVRANTLGFCF